MPKTTTKTVEDLAKKKKANKEMTLNQRQELFCQLYATGKEFFGNGVAAYLEAYDGSIDRSKPNWYKTACQSASRLLSNVKVCERINSILEDSGFNDVHVDKQLALLLTQHADFKTKLGAIKEYNKLKQRITEKSEIEHKGLTVIVEESYGTNKPKFRPDNAPTEDAQVAKGSS